MNDNTDFCLKGNDKLQKEMDWIDEKDRAGYTFAFLNNLAIQSNKQSCKDDSTTGNKDENMGESKLNRTFMRDDSSFDKSR